MTAETAPNLFIVGAPKCGTTSLHAYLQQHPEIFMATPKEPRYWSSDLRLQSRLFHRNHYRRHLRSLAGWLALPRCVWSRRRARPEEHRGADNLEDYLSVFRDAEPERHRFIGEASSDSMWSAVAARRIAAFCPQARVIVMLREPVSYIVSIHREACRGRVGERVRSLRKALALEPRRREGHSIPCTARYPFSVLYRQQAHFDEQVQRFLDAFPREQIHFVLLEDLAAEPVVTLDAVFAFLGVPCLASDLDLRPRNVSKPSRYSRLDSSWKAELRKEFSPVVARLERQTGLALRSRWGYSDVG